MRVYAACLASYNAGVLHGEWIDAEQDADNIRADIAKMLRASPYPNVRVRCPMCDGLGSRMVASCVSPDREPCPECTGTGTVPSAEEFAFHDLEGFPESFGESTGVDKIAEYAEAAGDMSEEEREGFNAWLGEHGNEPAAVDEFREAYRGCWPTFCDYAENFADDIGLLDGAPETLERYFDWESWSRDLRHDFTTHDGDHGVHVFDNHA